ncbi:MAG: leucyl/phenylalanyl-tRNA--protein transferase [Planctomycetota bacterium]|nr:leucyl/phenylalanyl-tRNA--protein transferase [Planctomycetota bacterium]
MSAPRHATPPAPLSPHEQRIVEQTLAMYREGWFPMAELHHGPDGTEIVQPAQWVQPQHRSIIPLDDDGLILSRSLRQRLRRAPFRVTTDLALADVLHACAEPRPADKSDPDAAPAPGWLSDEIIELVLLLGRAGIAHSVEAWIDPGQHDPADQSEPPRLVGGLYGIAIGRVFCGESMFSRPALGGTDASKVCLAHLWHHLRARGFAVLDTQIMNDHMARLGAREISMQDYQRLLHTHAAINTSAAASVVSWSPWTTPDQWPTDAPTVSPPRGEKSRRSRG